MTTGEGIRNSIIKNNRIEPDKIASVPTGVDEHHFEPTLINRKKSREKYGIPTDKVTIGILAVLRAFKRHDIFLKVARKVIESYPQTLFLIAGDGPKRSNIECIIKENNLQNNVKMLGHISKPADFLAALDLFLLTSDSSEGVPQSIIQSLMINLPVIATDAGSTKDLWGEGNFDLVRPNDINGMVKAIENFIENPPTEGYRKNSPGREFVMQHFTLSQMSEHIEEIYRKILDK